MHHATITSDDSPKGRPRDPSRDAAIIDAALDLLVREGVNVLCMSPTEYRAIAKRAELRALPDLRHACAAGEPLNPEVVRAWEAEAGVAIGLISHHFGSKDGLREAVESWIIDLFDTAIDTADQQSADPVADAAGRDAAVTRMLEDHPLVVDYLRRELLDSPDDRPLLTRLTALTRQSVDSMRATGLASTDRDRVEQVVTVMVRQLGKLFLQPLIDQIVDSFPAEERPAASPELSVEVSSAHR